MAQILIIEDDADIREILRLTLEGQGHAIIEAANGRQGMEVFQDNAPALVITDIIMPEQEGLETIIQMKKLRPEIKIIAISGGGRMCPAKDYLQMAKLMGAEKILQKPFLPTEIAEAVRHCLA